MLLLTGSSLVCYLLISLSFPTVVRGGISGEGATGNDITITHQEITASIYNRIQCKTQCEIKFYFWSLRMSQKCFSKVNYAILLSPASFYLKKHEAFHSQTGFSMTAGATCSFRWHLDEYRLRLPLPRFNRRTMKHCCWNACVQPQIEDKPTGTAVGTK